MDGCSLYALIACFSWSGLYIDSGLTYQDSGVEQTTIRSDWGFFNEYNLIDSETHSEHFARNPYGRLALGFQVEFRNVTLALEASHVSSLATGKDRGVNAIGINARWYPFR